MGKKKADKGYPSRAGKKSDGIFDGMAKGGDRLYLIISICYMYNSNPVGTAKKFRHVTGVNCSGSGLGYLLPVAVFVS